MIDNNPLTEDHYRLCCDLDASCQETRQELERQKRVGMEVDEAIALNDAQQSFARKIKGEYFADKA